MSVPAAYPKGARQTASPTTIYSGHTSTAAKSLLFYYISTINASKLAMFFGIFNNFLCKGGFQRFKGKIKEKSPDIL